MKRILKLFLLTLLLTLLMSAQVTYAQGGDSLPSPPMPPTLRFTHLTIDDGLPTNTLLGIIRIGKGTSGSVATTAWPASMGPR